MKNYTFIMAFVMTIIFSTISYAQVGIGNTNPQQELHISGANSTIRIDGLNSTNNTNNDGTDLAPIAVDENGDLEVRSAIYGDNIQSVILSSGTQNIDNTSSVDISGATLTFTPKHAIVYLSFSISGYNPLCNSDEQSWFSVRVLNNGSNVGNFLSMTATTDDLTGAVGAATITAANFPLSVTPGTPVTIKLQGRDGGTNHVCGFTIDRTNYTSYLTILD